MRIHILGISGTFMAGIAILAKQKGHDVTGSDKNFFDPMKTVLKENKIKFSKGYNPKVLNNKIDLVIVGNVMSRGMPIIEKLLESKIKYISGPQWLKENILIDKKVIAISGTHGKTTVSSVITHILKSNKINPSYLIGGQPIGFKKPANLTKSKYFVIEADEYDTAFFDKRSKFIHYKPDILLINNIEFDHADIFDNIDDILKNFHQLLRTIPRNGYIIYNDSDKNIKRLLSEGVWSKLIALKNNYWKNPKFRTTLLGDHNFKNIALSIIACKKLSLSIESIYKSIESFKGVKRRMEYVGQFKKIDVYDDFAHHPTAILSSIIALKNTKPNKKTLAICQIRSNSMIRGTHSSELYKALGRSDYSIIHFDQKSKVKFHDNKSRNINAFTTDKEISNYIRKIKGEIDKILIMSNGNTSGLIKLIKNVVQK
ncbi:MAG: Mur ligase family protein [Pseudomonadota bacterium]|nr:Mur ligase family protein [Pseudomonadota bacterium]